MYQDKMHSLVRENNMENMVVRCGSDWRAEGGGQIRSPATM